jgi:hypothetical protein
MKNLFALLITEISWVFQKSQKKVLTNNENFDCIGNKLISICSFSHRRSCGRAAKRTDYKNVGGDYDG